MANADKPPAPVDSLSRVRKARARAEAKAQADVNAARHGLGKAAKRALKAEEDRRSKSLDGAKRSDD